MKTIKNIKIPHIDSRLIDVFDLLVVGFGMFVVFAFRWTADRMEELNDAIAEQIHGFRLKQEKIECEKTDRQSPGDIAFTSDSAHDNHRGNSVSVS